MLLRVIYPREWQNIACYLKCYVLLRVFKSTNSGEKFKEFKVLPSKTNFEKHLGQQGTFFCSDFGIWCWNTLQDIAFYLYTTSVFENLRYQIHSLCHIFKAKRVCRALFIYLWRLCLATLLSCTEICIPFDMIWQAAMHIIIFTCVKLTK